MSRPHRESLAWQCTVQDDCLEEFGLVHSGQVETKVAGLGAQVTEHILIVYVINLVCTLVLHECIQKSLQGADRYAVQSEIMPYDHLLPERFRGRNERIDERLP